MDWAVEACRRNADDSTRSAFLQSCWTVGQVSEPKPYKNEKRAFILMCLVVAVTVVTFVVAWHT